MSRIDFTLLNFFLGKMMWNWRSRTEVDLWSSRTQSRGYANISLNHLWFRYDLVLFHISTHPNIIKHPWLSKNTSKFKHHIMFFVEATKLMRHCLKASCSRLGEISRWKSIWVSNESSPQHGPVKSVLVCQMAVGGAFFGKTCKRSYRDFFVAWGCKMFFMVCEYVWWWPFLENPGRKWGDRVCKHSLSIGRHD